MKSRNVDGMKKRKKTAVLAVSLGLVILLAGALIFLPRQEVRFDGDRISSAGRFALRFDRMNKTDSARMDFQAGDRLRVSWQIDGGSMDCIIGMEGEDPVYRAAGRTAGDAADFIVSIPKEGTYTISVSAKTAKGWIAFENTKHE